MNYYSKFNLNEYQIQLYYIPKIERLTSYTKYKSH
jgi:hypothetical protein